MGFDSSGKFTYDDLENKYKGFLAPDYEIKVGGTTIESVKVPVSDLTIELNVDKACSASFTVESLYDFEKSDWADKFVAKLNVGDKVEIQAGYAGSRKRIFLGYVDSYSIGFSNTGAPTVDIVAMDATMLMQNDKQEIDFGKKTYKDAIEELIKGCMVGDLVEKMTIGAIPKAGDDKDQIIVKDEQYSVHKYLSMLAQLLSYQFCVLDGELLFKNLMENTTPITTLTMGETLLSFKKRVGLSSAMVGKVVVKSTGDTKNVEPVKAECKASSLPGSGKAPSDLVKAIGAAIAEISLSSATTKEDCENAAKALMQQLTDGFVQADGSCIGVPELTPGRFITLKGLDKRSNGDYFMTSVKHRFSDSGYTCSFHLKGYKCS